MIYNYNSKLHKFKDIHDETGKQLKEFTFKYYDCFCGCADYEVVSTATRHKNHFNVVRCANCCTLRINPYMSEESVADYYKTVYGPVKRKNIEPKALYKRQKQSSPELFKNLSTFCKAGDAILDYGSGAGGRLDEFKNSNYSNLNIFDYDKNYLEFGIESGFKKHDPKNKYKLIILSHVIEHINDPVTALKDLAKNLASDGYIYLEVPMYENTQHLLGDFHLGHKFYFTNMSLNYLGNISGLEKVAEFHNAILFKAATSKKINFSSKEANRLWRQRKRIAIKLELWRKPRKYLKHKLLATKRLVQK